ncbi:DUF4362 domain-containing protein [Catellatospora citrea]|uniref:DUF4362 domain-containing protein n=1 Tax=Catellatospora citrea TaxID=53366 RepID=UPI0033F3A362
MMRWKALPALLLLLSAAACTPDRTAANAPGTPAGGPTGSPSPTAGAMLAADCGTHDLGHQSELPAASLSCLLDAVSGRRPAVLRVTRLTIEGDPIRFTYTVQQDGQVEVLTDTREDAFGHRGIMRELCNGPAAGPPALEFAQCSTPTPVR